ncbi:rhodanese-like domain-containing protein [uncultured Prevotella sp.]|uniref:rhodanese-like domain-containing protein n=1 Tax=uncultured Prevotella sp. TaxID=159272 RepID=UPI00261EFE4C|nr:rhodanese-like domain-containing protein [uncultured Prevotella sp.]
MNRLILSIMTLISGSLCSCGQQNFKTVDANEFENAISSDSVQLLDVRTAEEYNETHIAADSVINIDKLQPDFMIKARQILNKEKTVAVYCRSGRRSADAAKLLSEDGYKVIDLDGGIIEWEKRGKKTCK